MISRTALVVAGVLLALVIGTAAVFFASSDPDGLDSTALVVQGQKELTQPAAPGAGIDEEALPGSFEYRAPFADYTVDGASPLTNVALMVGGIVLALLVVAGILYGTKALGRSAS